MALLCGGSSERSDRVRIDRWLGLHRFRLGHKHPGHVSDHKCNEQRQVAGGSGGGYWGKVAPPFQVYLVQQDDDVTNIHME